MLAKIGKILWKAQYVVYAGIVVAIVKRMVTKIKKEIDSV